jgi:hypothetical protein
MLCKATVTRRPLKAMGKEAFEQVQPGPLDWVQLPQCATVANDANTHDE